MIKQKEKMAILFELDDQELIKQHIDKESLLDFIKNILVECGFRYVQPGLHCGNEGVSVVSCVIAIQSPKSQISNPDKLFNHIRLLRITEDEDLMNALQ